MRKFSFLPLITLLAVLLVPAAGALAQQQTPSDDEVNAVAHQLYCPVCENIPLDVCPTQACADWRALIKQMLTEGKTEQEIKDYFVAQYGDRVLGTPPTKGLTINWLAYIVPPVAILGGLFLIVRAFREWRRSGATTESGSPGAVELPDDEYIRRLEEEMQKDQG